MMNKASLYKYLGIITVTLFMPVLFGFNQNPFFSKAYLIEEVLHKSVYTIIIWNGNEFIFRFLKRKFPEIHQIPKKLGVEFVLCTIFTVIVGGYGCHVINPIFNQPVDTEKIGFFTKMSLGITYFILALYEGADFFGRWKGSLVENEKIKRKQLLSQFEALKKQVSPHFLFNSLNALASIIPEDSTLAVKFTEHLSKVYRYVLQHQDRDLVSVEEELNFIKSYYFLNQIRFGDNLKMNINLNDENLHKRIPPFSLQILVENAIKHNIIAQDRPLEIDVFNKDGRINVVNNLQKKEHSVGTQIGLKNIRERYKLFTEELVQIVETNDNFSVSLPILA